MEEKRVFVIFYIDAWEDTTFSRGPRRGLRGSSQKGGIGGKGRHSADSLKEMTLGGGRQEI